MFQQLFLGKKCRKNILFVDFNNKSKIKGQGQGLDYNSFK